MGPQPCRIGDDVPWYQPVGNRCTVFEHAHRNRLPVLLKGPTGCRKSRLWWSTWPPGSLPRSVTVACHDGTSAVDLVGRYLGLQGGETVWQDGPLTRAVRQGAVLYLDEVAEARPDVVVVIHPLADHRRQLVVDRRDEVIEAAPGFQLVVELQPRLPAPGSG
ncbi:MAG: AAA family ATPase [Myxococcota bacterium]